MFVAVLYGSICQSDWRDGSAEYEIVSFSDFSDSSLSLNPLNQHFNRRVGQWWKFGLALSMLIAFEVDWVWTVFVKKVFDEVGKIEEGWWFGLITVAEGLRNVISATVIISFGGINSAVAGIYSIELMIIG